MLTITFLALSDQGKGQEFRINCFRALRINLFLAEPTQLRDQLADHTRPDREQYGEFHANKRRGIAMNELCS